MSLTTILIDGFELYGACERNGTKYKVLSLICIPLYIYKIVVVVVVV